MTRIVLLTHAVLIGLTPLIPLPILDDLIRAYFYRGLVRALAQAHGLDLSADEIAALAEEPGRGCLPGCLLGTGEYLVKRLVRKLVFVLEWRRAISLVTHTYYVGHLLDYAFAQGWYTPGSAGRLRLALDHARRGADTALVRQVVMTSFQQSRALLQGAVQQLTQGLDRRAFGPTRLWLRRNIAARLRRRSPSLARWLYRFWRPGAAAGDLTTAEANLAETLERTTPGVNASLREFIERLGADLAQLPLDHFDSLQTRLAAALQAPGPAAAP